VGFFFIMRMEISLFLWKIFLVITLLDFEILELNRIMGMFLASGESMGFYSLNYLFFLIIFYTFFGQKFKSKAISYFFDQ
jgi:hypothetical protein